MSRPVDIGEIAGRLNDRIEALAAKLLPNGRKEGPEWRVGSVAGEEGRSLAVHLRGPRAGVWCDFGGPPEHRGDALDLVAQVLFRGDKRRAIEWARAWLGLDQVDPDGIAVERRRAVEKKRQARRDEERILRHAQKLYLEARPSLAGTASEAYLCGRGIDLRLLGRQPRALRHHPELVHPETGELAPGLVAAISRPDGKMAIHRTFLEPRGEGAVSKLRGVADAKLTLGRYAGGCIRLWRGISGKPFLAAERGEWITIGEGIEDTLTAVIARPDLRAACAVSLANMGGLWLPDAIEGVFILAQRDEQPQAQAALQRAIHHFRFELGKRVKLIWPEPGVKDINDMVRGTA